MTENNINKITIIGPGRLGSILACELSQAGYDIVAIAGGSEAQKRDALCAHCGAESLGDIPAAAIKADLVFLTVPDAQIEPVCELIANAGAFRAGQTVVHTSGALVSDALEAARRQGAQIASAHPLQTFAACEPGNHNKNIFKGAFWFIEGDQSAVSLLSDVARKLGSEPCEIDQAKKALYHAAAVVTSNCMTALVDISRELYMSVGMTSKDALKALAPLAKASLDNALKLGPADALTGPVSRGDIETIKKHLRAMTDQSKSANSVYRSLGVATVNLALRAGRLDEQTAREFTNLLTAWENQL